MTGPRRPAPADDEGHQLVRWPDTPAGHLDGPRGAAPPQPATSAAGLQPSDDGSYDGGPGGRRQEWRLPATELSVTVLRRGLGAFLREAHLSDDERYDLLLAASEAASNAIEHAGDPAEPFVEVLAEVGDAGVTITVCNHGRWRDVPHGIHRGRGLAMMWLLADTTLTAGRHGTTVTIRSTPWHGRRPAPYGGRAARNSSGTSRSGTG